MRGLRVLLLALIAVAFAAGGVLRVAPAQASAMPACHEMAADESAGELTAHDMTPEAGHAPASKAHKSKHGAMATSCCVGCLPAGQRVATGDLTPPTSAGLAFAIAQQAADGLDAAPEPRPPRG